MVNVAFPFLCSVPIGYPSHCSRAWRRGLLVAARRVALIFFREGRRERLTYFSLAFRPSFSTANYRRTLESIERPLDARDALGYRAGSGGIFRISDANGTAVLSIYLQRYPPGSLDIHQILRARQTHRWRSPEKANLRCSVNGEFTVWKYQNKTSRHTTS